MDKLQVLKKPLISEKSTRLKETANQVVFAVHPDANKYEIRDAVQDMFNVKVTAVQVVKYRPRVRSKFGRKSGHIPGYKKAYVTLADDSSIEFFEGV